MTYEEKLRFLAMVTNAVEKEPNLFSEIINACQYGINKKIALANERAGDFETVAVAFNVMATEKRQTKESRDWIAEIIRTRFEKWEGKTSMNWDAVNKALKENGI